MVRPALIKPQPICTLSFCWVIHNDLSVTSLERWLGVFLPVQPFCRSENKFWLFYILFESLGEQNRRFPCFICNVVKTPINHPPSPEIGPSTTIKTGVVYHCFSHIRPWKWVVWSGPMSHLRPSCGAWRWFWWWLVWGPVAMPSFFLRRLAAIGPKIPVMHNTKRCFS